MNKVVGLHLDQHKLHMVVVLLPMVALLPELVVLLYEADLQLVYLVLQWRPGLLVSDCLDQFFQNLFSVINVPHAQLNIIL